MLVCPLLKNGKQAGRRHRITMEGKGSVSSME